MNTVTLNLTVQTDTQEINAQGQPKNKRQIDHQVYQIKPSEWLTILNKLQAMNQLPPHTGLLPHSR